MAESKEVGKDVQEDANKDNSVQSGEEYGGETVIL